MTHVKIQVLLDQALSMDYGLSISAPTPSLAKHYKRKLYAARESLRKSGRKDYDTLSFVVRNQTEVWMMKRETVNSSSELYLLDSRTLDRAELPDRILSRGKSRIGLCISLYFFIIQGITFGLGTYY